MYTFEYIVFQSVRKAFRNNTAYKAGITIKRIHKQIVIKAPGGNTYCIL